MCVVRFTTNDENYLGTRYPTEYSKDPFFLKNKLQEPLERDTVITWTLKYKLRSPFNTPSDSLIITTLFKGISR